MSKSPTMILLHGAWHTHVCWQPIIPLLEAQGYQILAPDLPGHGQDPSDLKSISLTTYVDFTIHLINQCSDPVILVGHSMAGIILSQVGEAIPEKIQQLIYVAAFLPKSGESLFDQAQRSENSDVSTEMMIDEKRCRIRLKPSEKVMDLFYHQCVDKVARKALENLIDEPLRPMADQLSLTPDHFGSVKKRYIACAQDKACLLANQLAWCQGVIDEVVQIDCDHSPFYSAPIALAKAILSPPP